MEGATTGSGIIAASLARETSCESQLESAELGRIALLASITEQNLTLHQWLILTLSLHYHFRCPLTRPSGQNLHGFIKHFNPAASQLGMETLVSVTECEGLCLSFSSGSLFRLRI